MSNIWCTFFCFKDSIMITLPRTHRLIPRMANFSQGDFLQLVGRIKKEDSWFFVHTWPRVWISMSRLFLHARKMIKNTIDNVKQPSEKRGNQILWPVPSTLLSVQIRNSCTACFHDFLPLLNDDVLLISTISKNFVSIFRLFLSLLRISFYPLVYLLLCHTDIWSKWY